jgi:pyruvate kinase
LIITITETGNTSRQVAKYKPSATVYCITQHKETARQLTISRGLVPITVSSVIGTDAIIKKTINDAKQKGVVSSGDNVVVIFGEREGIAGHTNTLKCIVVN